MRRLLALMQKARHDKPEEFPLRSETHGLVPEDDLPYTEEDRENDRRFLGETISAYRAGLGWQTEEAKAVLDYWQQQTLKRLEGD